MSTEEVQQFLKGHKWTYAKTMPEFPHWYLLKKDAIDKFKFIDVARYIQQNGIPSEFKNITYVYLNFESYKYWTMGSSPEETTVINRALL